MMYMAKRTGDRKYLDAAKMLFQWSDSMYQEGGYYINDIDNDWSGITVFFSIQLGESLRWFSDLLTESEKEQWQKRFFETAQYVGQSIDRIGGTINYPAAGAYNMALAGILSEGQEREHYFTRAKELARLVCSHILPNGLIYGEGHPLDAITAKNHRAIDIGYNMEETIPALLEYAHLMQDEEAEELALKALKTHLKFYLPDGGLDNSFGSRSYKWSYWGSRTSDGIQAAAELVGDRSPEFRKVAYENALLLRKCTHDGLLYGGHMFWETGEQPCVHHTFCHAKVLAKALMIGQTDLRSVCVSAPATANSVEHFPELGTYLIRKKPWRATLTDYDYEYASASHATGGALTLLWHENVGVICAGTMNRYHVVEPNNMQILLGREDICLTPRIEYTQKNTTYRSIHDLSSDFQHIGNTMSFRSEGKLVDEQQTGAQTFRIQYDFEADYVRLSAESSVDAEFILPVVAGKDEEILYSSEKQILIRKEKAEILIRADAVIAEQRAEKRIFNPVGGFLAYPVRIPLAAGNQLSVRITVKPK